MIEAQGGVGEPGNAIQVPAAKKQVLKSEDLARLRDIGPPYPEPARHFIALSPDRQRIAFQVREGDPGANGYNLAMFVVALKPSATPVKIDEGGELILQKIAGLDGTSTDTGLPDTNAPLWSADGKTIYFLKIGRAHVCTPDNNAQLVC